MTLTFKVDLKDNIQQHMRHLEVATPFWYNGNQVLKLNQSAIMNSIT